MADEKKAHSKSEQRRMDAMAEAKEQETTDEVPQTRYFFPGDAKTPGMSIMAESQDEATAKYNEIVGAKNNG